MVEKCGAGKEDFEAVEVMMAGGIDLASKNDARSAKFSKQLAQQRDRQRELNQSRQDKVMDEPVITGNKRDLINSYNYYGENVHE